ncbi:hypothetical protein EJV46_15240 [Roseococcus sp. SYP-B2431]|uniref:hypothetical protein n=1 Tax=Roseococcus sp. SYP-B2431 TaxID=2496640 RepID=UPI0010401F72|nr:hypothetical protein [Roseococcus sp. SYP-B2431]TCH97480.1 hypothetical protein EJV46_15240 [Roseococcus sp. SYP-B2431]
MLDDVGRDAGAIAGRVQAQASEAVGAASQAAGKAAEEAKAQGAELLGQAQERAEGLVEEGKAAGAEQASGLARAVHRAADDLEGSSPDIARHVRSAADSLNGISEALRERSAGQLCQDVADFARRQPSLFFGAAAVAGFALVRFARSSAGERQAAVSGQSAPSPSRPSSGMAPGWTREGPGEVARPATMAGASLGGAAAHRAGDAEPGQMPTAAAGSVPKPRPVTAGGQTGGRIPDESSESPL